MSDLHDRIKAIHEKLIGVVEKLEKVEFENRDLKDTIVQMTKENKKKEALLTSLKDKLEEKEIEGRNDLNKDNIREKLEQYSIEIDTCIELANELVL